MIQLRPISFENFDKSNKSHQMVTPGEAALLLGVAPKKREPYEPGQTNTQAVYEQMSSLGFRQVRHRGAYAKEAGIYWMVETHISEK